MKHILFISYDGMTDPLGQSQVIPYLTGLCRYGFRFTIISCDKPDKFATYKESIRNILNPFPIQWVSLPYHKNPPVLSAIYDMERLKSKARQIHRKDPFDMVHSRAGTPALIGLWLKKKYGIKFLNDLRDFFADSRVDSGSWNVKNPIFKTVYTYFKKKELEAVRLNDGIVCLTHSAEKIIKSWPEYKQHIPMRVIPCSVDMELFNPQKTDAVYQERIKKNFKIQKGDILISYLGSLGGWYLTPEMMAFCKEISGKIPQAKFLFITPDSQKSILSTASKYGLCSDKIIITYARRNEVPSLLALSTWSLFFIKPCYSKQASSPTKHAEIMAMGIPLITNKGVGDVADIVRKYNAGIVLNDFSKETFSSTAQLLTEEVYFDPAKIRAGAREYYNLEKAIGLYKEIYDMILSA